MGYTHYWKTKREFTEEEWNKFTKGTKKIIKKSGVKICNGMGEDEPILTPDVVSLNGDASNGEDCESFIVTKEPQEFEFCKTRREPYDKVVCACLLLMEKILGKDVEVSSDGNRDTDWKDGNQLFKDAIKRL